MISKTTGQLNQHKINMNTQLINLVTTSTLEELSRD